MKKQYHLKTNKIFLLSIFLMLSGLVFGNERSGQIGGKVLDKSSYQPLAGANIVVTGSSRGASTDSDGHFIIQNLEPGSYNLEIYYLGYATLKKSNIAVNPNRTTVLELALEEAYMEGESVEVTAGYFEKAREAVVSARSMDFEEIRRSPGDLVDIQRAVQALPSVVSGSDQTNEIIIRGGYPGENLFVMDNIEIPNPNHFAIQGAGGGQINLLNSYMVRNLDFYAGAFSARYGDKASSVMDITLREGSRKRYRGEGSMGMAGLGLLAEGPLGSRGSFMVSARKSYLDWIVTSLDLTAIPNYYSFQAKLVYDLNKNNTLLFNAVHGADDINFEDEEEAGVGRGAENVKTDNDQSIFGLTLRTLWNRKLFSNTTISTIQNNYFVDVYDKFDNGLRDTYFVSDALENENTIKTDFTFQAAKRVEFGFGASYKNINFNYDSRLDADTLFVYGPGNVQTDSIFKAYPSNIVDKNVHSQKTAVYGQIALDLLKRFRLTAGLRYDYFGYNGFSSLSPRLGLSWFLNPRSTVSLAYGKHYQSPAYVDFAANTGNRDLKNKYTRHYVASFEQLIRDDIKLVVEAYYKTYHDVPVKQTLTTADPFDFDDGLMLNAGSGRSKGIELFFQKKITSSFSTLISYAHTISEAKDPRNARYYDWDYDYRDVFTLIGGYKFTFKNRQWYENMKKKWWFYTIFWLPFSPSDELELSLKFRYLGGRPYTPPVYYPSIQEWVVQETQQLNSNRYPAYHRLDLRIDHRFIFDNWSFVIFFDINNIYNRDNIWAYQYGVDDEGNKEVRDVLQYKTIPVGGFTIEF